MERKTIQGSASGKPVVGVTRESRVGLDRYLAAVELAGGIPLPVLSEGAPPVEADTLLDGVGALLLTGGMDIHPGRYAPDAGPDAGRHSNPERDEMEFTLIEAALGRDLPVLGICRGMQVLNVALGGALIPLLEGHEPVEPGDAGASSYHRIYIAPGSKLAAVVGSGGFVRVNSRHHLGLREAQKSARLLASAYSLEDGVIEGLESPEHHWVIGVQFHPERLREVPPHFLRLFQSLVDRAAEVVART